MENLEISTDNKANYKLIDNYLLSGEYIKTEISKFLKSRISGDLNTENIIEIKEKKESLSAYILSTFPDPKIIKGLNVINGHLVLYCDENGIEKTKVFNLLTEKPENSFVGDLDTFYKNTTETKSDLIKITEKSNNLVDAMEYIFSLNDKEIIRELNKDDILDTDQFGKELKGKNIVQIQQLLKEEFKNYDEKRKNLQGKDIKLDKTISSLKQKYLDYMMGVGDKYEGGANIFKKSKKEIDFLIKDVLSSKTVDGALVYLSAIHQKIDKNDYQSYTVQSNYEEFVKELHKQMFEKLKKDKASKDNDFLNLAKIITGRKTIISNGEIDDFVRDPDLANDIIIYLVYRENGIMSKVNTSDKLKIKDEKVEKQSPYIIVSQLTDEISGLGIIGNDQKKVKGKDLLSKLGYDDVLSLKNQKYDDLNFEQKTKISTLFRLWEKIKQYRPKTMKDFGGLFGQVTLDSRKELLDLGLDKFDWGKNAKDYGLNGVDKEIFEIYQNINGHGLFTISDEWVGYNKTIGKVLGIVGVAGLSGAIASTATLGYLATAAVVGTTATLGSMAINPQGYDTNNELITDVSTDILIGAGTGVIGEYFSKNYGKTFVKKAGIFIADIGLLGIGTEIARNNGVGELVGRKKEVYEDNNK